MSEFANFSEASLANVQAKHLSDRDSSIVITLLNHLVLFIVKGECSYAPFSLSRQRFYHFTLSLQYMHTFFQRLVFLPNLQ